MRNCINHSLLSVKLVLLWTLDIILLTYFLYLCEHNKTIILYNIFCDSKFHQFTVIPLLLVQISKILL